MRTSGIALALPALLTLLTLLAPGPPLRAQQDTVARRDTAILAPTVVTVTRTAQTLARAPIAIGVVTRDDIQRGRPGLALDEALAVIPGVQVDNRFNYALGERISVRGMGARAQFGVRGVRVLLDGIPMTLADGQTSLNNVDVAALSRAEVIRGAASTLYGNASGGVLQLESDRGADLTTGPLGGEVRVVAGSHDMLRTSVALGGNRPGLDFTAAVSRLRYGGFRQWSDARNDHAHVRFSRGFAGGDVALVANVVDYDGKNPGGLSRPLLANPDTSHPANTGNRTGERGSQGQLGGTWTRQFRGAAFTMAAHGLQRTIDNPIPGTIVAIDRRAGGLRVGVDNTRESRERAARIALGAELQMQDDDRRNFTNSAGARGATTLDQRERVRNASVFAQSLADVTPRIRVVGGLRYDRIAFTADDRHVTATNPDDSGDRTMSSLSPSIGATWTIVPRLNVYANVSTAFETPTTSELANQATGAGGLNPQLEPQRTVSHEVGIKGGARAAGLLASYDMTVYAARTRDALVPFQNTAGRTFFTNAAAIRTRGVEVAGTVYFPGFVSLRTAFTHTEARFDDYTVGSSTGSPRVYDGNRVPGVAPNRLEATLSAQPGRAFVDVDARAYSAVPVNDGNTERAAGYVLWSTRFGLREVGAGPLRVSPHVAVQNIFGRAYITAVTVNAVQNPPRYFEPGPGRTMQGGVGIRF